MILKDFDLVVSIVNTILDRQDRIGGHYADRSRVNSITEQYDREMDMLRNECSDRFQDDY